MKIISWNIRQGGGTRFEAISNALIHENCDVIVLSEFQNNAAGQWIRIKLLMNGYLFQSPSSEDKEKNGVLIATRVPCSFILDTHTHDFPESVLICCLNNYFIVGVYPPHKKKHARLEYIIEKLKSSPYPSIITGDFNTGFNYIDQEGDSFWYQEQLRSLNTLDVLDAWRIIHGNKKEYSWYSHQQNGYRYDHTWISKQLVPLIKECYYLHEWRKQGLSDHSPMMLHLSRPTN